MKAIINAKLYDYDQYINNGYILYDQQIVEVGEMSAFNEVCETYDAQGKLLLPGLINAHTHIYSTLFRGAPVAASPSDFMGVLEEIWWPFDRALDLKSIKCSALMYGKDSLKAGVTSLIDHHASGEIKNSIKTIHDALEIIGMKHLLCFETSDRFELTSCINENKYSIKQGGFFGLHAGLSLSNKSLEIIKNNLGDDPIHIHVAESHIDEIDSKQRYDQTVVDRLNDHQLLNKDSILAHCVHIDELEAKMIKEKGCYVAINPTSNLNNAVGLFNSQLLLQESIDVLVGTDGLGVNVAKEWQNLYYVGKQSMNHPSGITLDWIKNQLVSGYEFFSRRSGSKIGKLVSGYDGDFILVDYDFVTPISKENIFAHVLFGVFEGLKPYAVYTNGLKRVDHYQYIQNWQEDKDAVAELWGRLS